MTSAPSLWPTLDFGAVAPTVDHLHRLSQIGGKYTLDQPFEHNWGNIVLTVTPRGLATPPLYAGGVPFVVEAALLDDRMSIVASTGRAELPLGPGSVAGFYERFVAAAAPLGIGPPRSAIAAEIPDAVALDADDEQRPYDAAAARTLWAALAGASSALTVWQSAFRGHRPRVGLMWGGFDLSATRYNGRLVAPPPSKPVFMRNGMYGEVVSVGFTFGDTQTRTAGFYAYVSPEPEGMADADLGVEGAAYVDAAGLAFLPWDAVLAQPDREAAVVRFGDAVYTAAVERGGWPADLVETRRDGWYASANVVFAG